IRIPTPLIAHGSRPAAARPVAKAVHAGGGAEAACEPRGQQAVHRQTKSVVPRMNANNSGSIQKAQKANHVQAGGPNWILVASGVLLSTLSVRLGCKLKQLFVTKQKNSASKGLSYHLQCNLHPIFIFSKCLLLSAECVYLQPKEDVEYVNCTPISTDSVTKPDAIVVCQFCFPQQTEERLVGHADGGVEVKQAPSSPVSKSTEPSNLLVKIPGPESSKENSGVMWSTSPDRLEDPRKPFQYSNCSGSPSVSESGSDIYNKREVIQKLRQQLKRRDEMIMEMQAQIADLKNSLSIQVTQNTNLQSQLDATNRDLFESEREIQHLRKIIADHCVAEALLHDKPFQAGQWQSNGTNGHVNGYSDSSVDDPELHCNGIEKRKGEAERLEMLRREVGELKEVIEGKDFLLQSYKEQKVELCCKIRELQEKLSAQVPSIL
ncbi:hypothetical protein EJB05_57576, partial [Eragrostis curvula]